jgi:hypothetical protein
MDVRRYQNEGSDIVYEPGQNLQRVSSSNKESVDLYKYMSSGEAGRYISEIGTGNDKIHEYENDHKMAIAGAKTIVNQILKEYGDKTLFSDEVFENSKNIDTLTDYLTMVKHYQINLTNIDTKYKNMEISSKIAGELYTKGYDAMVDLEDKYQLSVADTPIIAFDTDRNLKLKSVKTTKEFFGD